MSDSQTQTPFVAPDIAQLAPLFPGYEIESLIATGGMGAVYCAVQKSLDRTVAIKILPREFGKDAAFCAGFEAEAKAMARLNHPNLIGVYDFGEVEGMLYIIMEFVPGKSLYHSAYGIAIDAGETIRLVTGICNGLAHAHAHGIIHRDIKPSNILLDLNAQPKIGDFGLAHPVGRKIEEGEEIFGTPHYTAPEVVNSPQSVNDRADIFSVGVLLHELLTGRLPAADRRPASAIIHCDPRFDAIIRRATNPQPELRYASAAEIAKDLRAIAQSTGSKVLRTPARAGSVHQLAGRPMVVAPAKNSSSVPLIAALSIGIALAAALVYYFSRPQETPATVSNEPATGSSAEAPPSPHPNPVIPLVKPKPVPTPTPKTEPKPEPPPEPKPKPEPEPEPVTEPPPPSNPTPEPVVPTQPKFDVPAFLARARQIMKDRAAPLIANRDAGIKKCLLFFDRDAKRAIRKIDGDKAQEHEKTHLEDYVKECKKNGHRLPTIPNEDFPLRKELHEIRDEYIDKQKALDDTLMQELTALSATYISGINIRIDLLKTAQDTAAAALLTEEVDAVHNNAEYFPDLMLGIDPTKQEPPKDDSKNPAGP